MLSSGPGTDTEMNEDTPVSSFRDIEEHSKKRLQEDEKDMGKEEL